MTEAIKKATKLDASGPAHIVLHYMTQNGQPLGSARRCCERCAVRLWIPSDGSYTDDAQLYHAPPRGYLACWIPRAIQVDRDRKAEEARERAENDRRRRQEEIRLAAAASKRSQEEAVRASEEAACAAAEAERAASDETLHTSWEIIDRENGRPYVGVVYTNKIVAERELASLLRVYPADHEWRARLHLRGRK